MVLDLDGVVYLGSTPIAGAVETIRWLRQSGRLVKFCTNNATRSRQHYAEKLSGMGIPSTPSDVVTSAYAVGLYLRQRSQQPFTVLAVGEEGLRIELSAAGATVLERVDVTTRVDYVVVGLDRAFTYQKLEMAFHAIRNGAEFIATNRDAAAPMEKKDIPGAGAIVAAIEAAVGQPPAVVIGKPQPTMLELLMAESDVTPAMTLFVGDRLETDVLAGRRAGTRTACVLTGIASAEDVRRAPPEMQPDVVIANLRELKEWLGEAAG
ncbi:MAG: HAD-IIA family hydrolase [Abditibacteriales bacterium]|nr:HAD-IIA family hydrolase [Abditibacteriales bacterium]